MQVNSISSLLPSEEKGQLFTILLRVELKTPEQRGSPGAFIIPTKQHWYISSSQRGSLTSGICLCWEPATCVNSQAAPQTCFVRDSERGAGTWCFSRPSWGPSCSLMFENYWRGRCFDQMWAIITDNNPAIHNCFSSLCVYLYITMRVFVYLFTETWWPAVVHRFLCNWNWTDVNEGTLCLGTNVQKWQFDCA